MHATLCAFLKYENEKGKNSQEDLFGFKKKNLGNLPPAKSESAARFEDLAEIYEKNWIDEWYESKKQKEDYYKLGKKIIKDFYEEFLKNSPKILKINNEIALEIPFNLKIGGNNLYGVIDRIDEKAGGVLIMDYKTGNAKEKLTPEDKEQLLIYQIAAEEIFKIKPKELTYYYLNEGKKASFLVSETEKEKLKEKIIKEIEEIKKSDFA